MRQDNQEYLDMLRYKRPARSKSEIQFIAKYIDTIPNVRKDAHGNRYVRVGDFTNRMFSCHTDTMHTTSGKQTLVSDEYTVHSLSGECLGADDTTGIYIMKQMIRAGIEGLYVFHRDEETGGKGSAYFAENTLPSLGLNINICIAFDRAGYFDVITHQWTGRTASDDFAKQLASIMYIDFEPSSEGVFTDSANYVDYISECTNISVGYFNEHTPKEYQDLIFLEDLIDALLNADFASLSTSRDLDDQGYSYEEDDYMNGRFDIHYYDEGDDDVVEVFNSLAEIEEFVWNNPTEAAAMIGDLIGVYR